MKITLRKIVTFILVFGILFQNFLSVEAGETQEGAENWSVSSLDVEHTSISFRISGVESAQTATAVITDDPEYGETAEILFELPFSITSSTQDITISLTDGNFLASGERYCLYVRDSSGNQSDSDWAYLSEHYFWFDAEAYPDYMEISNLDDTTLHFTATVGFEKYETNIAAGQTAQIKYPRQTDGAIISLRCDDGYGCESGKEYTVENTIGYLSNIDMKVLKDSIILYHPWMLDTDERIVAEVEGKVYYGAYGVSGEYGTITDYITYPQVQSSTTSIEIWLESKNGSTSEREEYTVESCSLDECEYTCTAYLLRATGTVASNNDGASITKVSTTINGTVYSCNVDANGSFTLQYPQQKAKAQMTFTYTDKHGCTVTHTAVVKNVKPSLKINKIDASSTKVTGSTEPGSKVTVKVGKKKYTGKAKSSGKYSVKIKSAKPGTKVKVSVVTADGYTASKNTKIKVASGSVSISNTVYRTSGTVRISVTNGKKSDRLTLKVGGRTYKKTIRSDKKKQTISFSISKASAGSSVSVELRDKYNNKKASDKGMVYYGDRIYTGMSASDAVLTTWGYPVRRNNWGTGALQWVFESGSKTLYVYIRNGVVSNLQELGY